MHNWCQKALDFGFSVAAPLDPAVLNGHPEWDTKGPNYMDMEAQQKVRYIIEVLKENANIEDNRVIYF